MQRQPIGKSKANFSISALRPHAPDPTMRDKFWEKLSSAIDEIFHKNNAKLSFEEIYRYVGARVVGFADSPALGTTWSSLVMESFCTHRSSLRCGRSATPCFWTSTN